MTEPYQTKFQRHDEGLNKLFSIVNDKSVEIIKGLLRSIQYTGFSRDMQDKRGNTMIGLHFDNGIEKQRRGLIVFVNKDEDMYHDVRDAIEKNIKSANA